MVVRGWGHGDGSKCGDGSVETGVGNVGKGALGLECGDGALGTSMKCMGGLGTFFLPMIYNFFSVLF